MTTKERPILFSAPMVSAILEGRKTQTRRVVKQPKRKDGAKLDLALLRSTGVGAACPYGQVGDRLWVRETFFELVTQYSVGDSGDHFALSSHRRAFYAVDGIPPIEGSNDWGVTSNDDQADRGFFPCKGSSFWHKRPSIFMPRWASRLSLEITGVRVERLQALSEADALAEGIVRMGDTLEDPPQPTFGAGGVIYGGSPLEAFEYLWRSINGDASWGFHPWVWVVEFRRAQ